MPSFSNIDGEESASVTFTVAAVSLTRNSSAELQEILCLGDPEVASSLGIARVLNTAPASTAAGLCVRVVGGPSSVADFSVRAISPSTAADNLRTVYQSTAADLNVTVAGYSTIATVSTGSVRVHQSTAADLNVTVAGYSTIATVSTGSVRVHQSTAADLNVTVAGYSTIATVSTGSVRVHQSTAADLNVTVAGYSTTVNVSSVAGAVVVRVNTSSGGAVEGSTITPSTGELGLNVRWVQPTGRQSTSILVLNQTAGGSTALISSVAALKHKVYAFGVYSTVTDISSAAFLSSAVIERWGMILGSGSSGITGANLAVSPPGFLFETVVANALNFTASATGLYRVSLSWFTEA